MMSEEEKEIEVACTVNSVWLAKILVFLLNAGVPPKWVQAVWGDK